MQRISSAEQLEIHEEVGRGAFGVVYRGVVLASLQEVAVKQIDLEHELADFQEVYKEIQILSECQLPQITAYLGCFVKRSKLWVIMEFVDGGAVFDILKAGPITGEGTVATLAHEVLLALDYLHAQRKIHRDLKSANILVSCAGEVKLTDFGVSTQLQSHFSRRNTTVGTPYWMAPEIINNTGRGHGFEADVWSLGSCIYEFLTGKPPLQNQYSPMQALRRISAVESTGEFFGLLGVADMALSPEAEDFLRVCFSVLPRNRPAPRELLQHAFLKKRAVGEAKKTCLQDLVARKQRWDSDNYNVQSKKYYTPTERRRPDQSVRFDISTIGGGVAPAGQEVCGPVHKASPAKNSVKSRRGPQKADFQRVLGRVLSKVKRKSALSSVQEQQLVALNDVLLEAFVHVQSADMSGQSRVLVCQYLRYMVKEIRGCEFRALQKAVLPSDSQAANPDLAPSDAPELRRPVSAMDEIERSLLASWLDSMHAENLSAATLRMEPDSGTLKMGTD